MSASTPDVELAPRRSLDELLQLLDEYVAIAHEPGPARERLDAWASIRAAARRHWEELLEAERFGQDVSDAATWKLLPHEDGPLARQHGAFVHELSPAVGRDVHAWFEGAGWVRPEQWPDLGRGLFDLVRRCSDHPAELWPAIEAFLTIPGSAPFTTEMIAPVLHALRPSEYVLVDAACRALLNHATGSAFSGTLRDFPAAHAAARRLLAELRPVLAASALSDRRPEDALEGFCHWVVHVRLMRVEEPAEVGADRGDEPAAVQPVESAAAPIEPEIEATAIIESTSPAEIEPADAATTTPVEAADLDFLAPAEELRLELDFDDSAELPSPPDAVEAEAPAVETAPAPAALEEWPVAPAPSARLDRARAALERRGQIVLAGSPRGAASHLALALAEELVAGGDGFIEHVVFHPAWRYADFMQVDGSDGARRTGRFPAFCQAAAARRDACVLVVDEAERAELSAVCGEALALLGLRGRAVALAGGGTLAVPANVRVVFTLDGASRAGRDALVELAPLCEVLDADETTAD